jgi:Ni,Fe-hydrogenase III small subunit
MAKDTNEATKSSGLLSRLSRSSRAKSLWVYHLNTGSCNACDSEIESIFGPRYDAERLGIKLVSTPKHADVVLVTGPVTKQSREPFLRTLEMVPEPKVVVALGTCALTGEPFVGSPMIAGPANKLVPVDISIPGCPIDPPAVIEAILRAGQLLKQL